MLFFKFQLSEFMEEFEIAKSDYEKWFKKDAVSNNVQQFIYNKLFGDKDERNNANDLKDTLLGATDMLRNPEYYVFLAIEAVCSSLEMVQDRIIKSDIQL